MDSRKSQVLLGSLLLVFAISTILINLFDLRYDFLLKFMLGLALVFLYIAKGKIWALIIGCLIITSSCLDYLHCFSELRRGISGGLFFFIPGCLLIWLSRCKKQNGYMSLGCFAVWAGIYIMLTELPFFASIAGALFFFCIGLGCVSVYLARGMKSGSWMLFLGILNLIIGVFLIKGNPVAHVYFNVVTYAACGLLILVSIAIIIKGIKNK